MKPILSTEFNIEGNPIPDFMELVLAVRPDQVTLVPDAEHVLTSNAGWNTKTHHRHLKEICSILEAAGIRSSIFVDPDPEMVRYAVECGCRRVELYTEAYASGYQENREAAIAPYVRAAEAAREVGLELNAGHDLNLDNLRYFKTCIPYLAEVSIGHALISDALYLGLETTIKAYLEQLAE